MHQLATQRAFVQASRDAIGEANQDALLQSLLVGDGLLLDVQPFLFGDAQEVVEQIRPYIEAGATRIILPYVAASDDIVGEMKNFIDYWSPATTGLMQ